MPQKSLHRFLQRNKSRFARIRNFCCMSSKNISDAMRNLDFDEADRQAEWLERHRYEETTEEDIRELLSQVIRLDDREAMQTAGRLIERLQTEEVT